MITVTDQQFVHDPRLAMDRAEADGLIAIEAPDGRKFFLVAELKPGEPRQIGVFKGMFTVPDDFNAPMTEDGYFAESTAPHL